MAGSAGRHREGQVAGVEGGIEQAVAALGGRGRQGGGPDGRGIAGRHRLLGGGQQVCAAGQVGHAGRRRSRVAQGGLGAPDDGGGRGVARLGAQSLDVGLQATASLARLGEVQGFAGHVAGIGQATLPVEDGRQPVEAVGGIGRSVGGDQEVCPGSPGRLVGRGTDGGTLQDRERLGRPIEPDQDAAQPGVRQDAVGRELDRLAIGDDRFVELAPTRGDVAAAEGELVALEQVVDHEAASPPSSSTRSAFWTWSRFSD